MGILTRKSEGSEYSVSPRASNGETRSNVTVLKSTSLSPTNEHTNGNTWKIMPLAHVQSRLRPPPSPCRRSQWLLVGRTAFVRIVLCLKVVAAVSLYPHPVSLWQTDRPDHGGLWPLSTRYTIQIGIRWFPMLYSRAWWYFPFIVLFVHSNTYTPPDGQVKVLAVSS